MELSIKNLIDAGVHFGHSVEFGNPKMKPYIYTKRDGIHIINLQKSVVLAKEAMNFMKSLGERKSRIIFVGTKKQAQDSVEQAAEACDQFYVTKKWLGGMLTNFTTIKESINRLKKIEAMKEKDELSLFSKAELIKIQKEHDRLYGLLKGIYSMNSLPQALFIVDIKKEKNAVAEARKLGIPVVAPVDTNCNPELVDYPIPANDDAKNSISLFLNLATEAYLEGRKNAKDISEEEMTAATQEHSVDQTKNPNFKQKDTPAPTGPEIVKTSKGVRTMVAAGTADIIEIQKELEEESSKPKVATLEEKATTFETSQKTKASDEFKSEDPDKTKD